MRERQDEETAGADWRAVDVGSTCDMDERTIGVEHATWQPLELPGLPALIDKLGSNRRQRRCAPGSVIALPWPSMDAVRLQAA